METIDDKRSPITSTADSTLTENESIDSWTILDHRLDDLGTTTLTQKSPLDLNEEHIGTDECERAGERIQADHDGDLSDGISVISETDSNRYSPQPNNDQEKASADECHLCQQKRPHSIQDLSSSVDQYPALYQYDQLRKQYPNKTVDDHPSKKWNSTIILAIIAGITAMILVCYIKSIAVDDAVHPMISLLSQRIEKLERENIAIKMEVSRVLDLLSREEKYQQQYGHKNHRKPDDIKKNDSNYPSKSFKQQPSQKKVWSGDDRTDNAIHAEIPSNKIDYCSMNLKEEDNLYAEYNQLKCNHQRRKEEYYKNEKKSKNSQIHHKEKVNIPDSGIEKKHSPPNKDLPDQSSDRITEQSVKINQYKNYENEPIKYHEKQGKNYRPHEPKTENIWTTDPNTKGEFGMKNGRDSAYGKANDKYDKNERKKSIKKDRKYNENNNNMYAYDSNHKATRYSDEIKNPEKSPSQNAGIDDGNWYLDRATEREKARGSQPNKYKVKYHKYPSDY